MPPKTVGPRRGEWFLGEPAGGGSTTLPCQRTVAHLKHGGGKPEGKEGEIKITPETNGLIERLRARRNLCTRRRGLNLTPMSEDGSIFIPLSTPQPLSEHPRTDSLFVASPSTPQPLSEPPPRTNSLFTTSPSTTSTHSEPFRNYLHICIKTRFIGQNSAIKWRFGENVGGGRSCGKLAAGKVAGER